MKNSWTFLFLSFYLISCSQTDSTAPLPPQAMSAEHYPPAAVSISAEGKVQTGPEAIAAYWKSLFGKTNLPGRAVIGSVPVGKKNEYTYEISRFETAEQQAFAQVIIWDNQGAEPLRALEFVAPYGNPLDDVSVIDTARAHWMEYCNAHEVEQLIHEMYTSNTLYYNHRPLLKGREALVQEYAYMQNPAYALTLTPLHVVPVSEALVIELGQCSGSYGGKYLIVWQKQEDGNWQVLLDGNL